MLATVSRPDICACPVQLAALLNFLQGSSNYTSRPHRVALLNFDNLIGDAKDWEKATTVKYASSSSPSDLVPRSGSVDCQAREIRVRGERAHCGTVALAGRSDAARGGQTKECRRRSGYAIGLISSSLREPCYLLQWLSR